VALQDAAVRIAKRFRCDVILDPTFTVEAGETKFWTIESRKVLNADETQFLLIKSNVEGVEWWFVNQEFGGATSPVAGSYQRLYPFGGTTQRPWSVGSLPSIVVRNPTSEVAEIKLAYGRLSHPPDPSPPPL
jgi:hypothetical protein